MNLDQLKKHNIGFRVQLEPPAVHLDALGREGPMCNEDWIIHQVSIEDEQVHIATAEMLPLATVLGKDAIHSFATNPSRTLPGGPGYGFLKLTMQMYIQNDRITYRPCVRPGERLPPPAVEIGEKYVDSKNPVDSGLAAKLESSGYRIYWCAQSRVARKIDLEGWEVVVERDSRGTFVSYHVRTAPENMVLIKTRNPDLEGLANLAFWSRQHPGLVSCEVGIGGRPLVFQFGGDPGNAIACLFRMNQAQSGFHCEMMSGRANAIVCYPKDPDLLR